MGFIRHYSILYRDRYYEIDDFQAQYLIPEYGKKKAAKIWQQFLYRVHVCNNNASARRRLERLDPSGFVYIHFKEFGANILARCRNYDGFCEIIIVEYGKANHHPP